MKLEGPLQAQERFASKNPPPSISNRESPPIFSRDFDKAEARRIVADINKAVGEIDENWRHFVKHSDDMRYCITVRFERGYGNLTVADVCSIALTDAIAGAYLELLPRNSYFSFSNPSYIPLKDEARLAWWNTQSKSEKQFFELQAEATNWALDEVSKSKNILPGVKDKCCDSLGLRVKSLLESKKAVNIGGFFGEGRLPYIP